MSVFFCASHCAIGCCLVGKERNGAASSLRRCAHNPDKVVEGVEDCSEYLHFDSLSALFYFRLSARCSKNCELSAKSSPFLTENSPFSRVSSGVVGVSRHVGGENHALRRVKMRGGKSWRAGKKTVSLRRYAAHATFLLSRPAVPHASRSPSARAGTRPATGHALLACTARYSVDANLSFHFPPLQQQFSC